MKTSKFPASGWVVAGAVVAVVAVVAIPEYQAHTSNKVLAQVTTLLQHQFDTLAERHTSGQTEPVILHNPSPIITSIVSTPNSNGGTITVHFAQTATLNKAFASVPVTATYTATNDNGVLSWSCGPLTSTGNLAPQDRATINVKYLTKPQCS